MIHIADTKVARRYGDFFIRQIHKFEEVRGVESGVGAADGSWEWSGEFLSVLFLISIFLFLFFSHLYFQESLKLAFEVSELDRLAAWGLEGGAGPVGVAVSAFFGASLPKISLCGWPALASLPVIS